jgi:uncharacterized protein YjbJ (UPF0337 family)
MNKEQATGQWDQLKGKFKETWGKLTDDDIETFKGKKDQFFGKLKEHYGIGKEEAEKQIAQHEKDCGCASSTNTRSAA